MITSITAMCVAGKPNVPHTAVGSQVFKSTFFCFYCLFFILFSYIMTHDFYSWKELREPHSTACLLNNVKLCFTCYHFATGTVTENYIVAQVIMKFEGTTVAFRVRMGSGIATLLFFQGLCETSSHSAWATVHVKRKAPLFMWTVCPCLGGWKCCRYLGISNAVVMLFQRCFSKGQLAVAICLGLKIFSCFSIKNIISNAVSIRAACSYCYML
jgi:hypothetical protein